MEIWSEDVMGLEDQASLREAVRLGQRGNRRESKEWLLKSLRKTAGELRGPLVMSLVCLISVAFWKKLSQQQVVTLPVTSPDIAAFPRAYGKRRT